MRFLMSAYAGSRPQRRRFVMWHRQVPYDEQYHLATMK
jgi:hypothetical protein